MKRLLFLIAACAASIAWAAPGHDHGPQAQSHSAQKAAPRFGTHSDTFELVGVLENGTLVLYLDRYATNEPVTGAQIDIEGDSIKGSATAADDGTYRIAASALAAPGKHLMILTITAGADADLLEAALTVEASGTPAAVGFRAMDYWPYALAALSGLAVATLVLFRKGSKR